MPSSLKKSGRLQRRFFAAPTRPPGSAHTSPPCSPSLTQGAPVRLGRPHRGPNTPSRPKFSACSDYITQAFSGNRMYMRF